MENSCKTSSLRCYVTQLENEISEVEKVISFKTNILKWAIKSDNLEMCLNLAQIIIMKTDELQMLNDVHRHILNWQMSTSEVLHSRYEEKIIQKFKTAFHLMEEVPTAASYAAFNQLASVFTGNNTHLYDTFKWRPISLNEKKSYIKKFIEETCAEMRVPERIYKVVFEDDDRPRQKMAASNTKTILSEDRRPSSMEILGSPTPPPKPSTSVHRTFFQENVNSKSCVQSDMQPQQKTLSAVQISFDQTDRKSAKVEPLSALLESAQTPEKNHLPFGNLTDEQQNLTYPRIRVRKPANQTEIPKLPWYYRKLSQPNLWLQRSSDNNNVARCSSATFGVDMSTTPSPSLEEPTPLTPVEEHIYRTSLSQNVEEIPPIQIRSSTEDAKWENTDSLRKFLDVSGRSRAADKHPPVIQTRNSVESPRPNCFPPLQLLTQLRQQEFESVKAWLSRTESQLWLYLKPTCREYEVILRWLLSCGRRGGESVTASTSLTLNELLLQLTERDDCPTNKSVTSVLYENTN